MSTVGLILILFSRDLPLTVACSHPASSRIVCLFSGKSNARFNGESRIAVEQPDDIDYDDSSFCSSNRL